MGGGFAAFETDAAAAGHFPVVDRKYYKWGCGDAACRLALVVLQEI